MAIDRIKSHIWLLSGITPSLLENKENTNNIPMSGAALRRLAITTTVRIRGFWEVLDDGIKDLIMGQVELSQSNGGEVLPVISKDDIEIDFGEPLFVAEDSGDEEENDPTPSEDTPPPQ